MSAVREGEEEEKEKEEKQEKREKEDEKEGGGGRRREWVPTATERYLPQPEGLTATRCTYRNQRCGEAPLLNYIKQSVFQRTKNA